VDLRIWFDLLLESVVAMGSGIGFSKDFGPLARKMENFPMISQMDVSACRHIDNSDQHGTKATQISPKVTLGSSRRPSLSSSDKIASLVLSDGP
jgi:hypothetical protein